MERKAVIYVLFAIVVAVAAGCASLGRAGHEYVMRGQVLEVSDGMAYLCLGSKDGAKVGQEFTVHRFVREMYPYPEGAATPRYKREMVGKIKIGEVVDEHMARAKVLSGEVKEHDVAELD